MIRQRRTRVCSARAAATQARLGDLLRGTVMAESSRLSPGTGQSGLSGTVRFRQVRQRPSWHCISRTSCPRSCRGMWPVSLVVSCIIPRPLCRSHAAAAWRSQFCGGPPHHPHPAGGFAPDWHIKHTVVRRACIRARRPTRTMRFMRRPPPATARRPRAARCPAGGALN